MKRFFFSLIALFLCSRMEAQQNDGTKDDGFLLKLFLPDGSKPLFENREGGYGYALFGGEVLQEMEGDMAWARTVAGDSLCCAPVVNDLSGKIALIRRGGNCNLSLKCFFAQQSGAKAVIVLNHYTSVADDENTIFNMQGGTNADSVTVPCIFVCRKVSELMVSAIHDGQPPTVGFVFKSLDKTTAAYHYATPKSQVDTLKHITAHFFNPTPDTLFGVTVNAQITEPGGNVVLLSVPVASLLPRQDTLLFFPPYLPPATLGDFEVVFSNTAFSGSEDTVKRRFRVSDYTWASDNGEIVPGGIPMDFSDIIPIPISLQTGALYRSGPTGGTAEYATFGLANASEIALPGIPDANIIAVILYDADPNNDGEVDLKDNWHDLDGAWIGQGLYEMTGNEKPDSLINIPIVQIGNNWEHPHLNPQHWYYLSLFYDGSIAFPGTGKLPRFSIAEQKHYFDFPSSLLQFDENYIPDLDLDYTIIQRLQLADFDIDPISHQTPLDSSKFTISPNPANDFLQLDLRLVAANKKVAASLLDGRGRGVASEKRADFQEGTISFDVKNLPSGTYLLWVRTEEGSAMRKVMICR